MAAMGRAAIQNPHFFVRTFEKPPNECAPDAVDLNPDPLAIHVRLRGTLMFRPPTRQAQLAEMELERKQSGKRDAGKRGRPQHTAIPSFADAARLPVARRPSLFERMGGAEAMERFVNKFRELVVKDPVMKAKDRHSISESPILELAFLRMVMGGPGCYDGKTLYDAHHPTIKLKEPQILALRTHYTNALSATLEVPGLLLKDLDRLWSILEEDLRPRGDEPTTKTPAELAALSAAHAEAEASYFQTGRPKTPDAKPDAPEALEAPADSAPAQEEAADTAPLSVQEAIQDAVNEEAEAIATAVQDTQSGGDLNATIAELQRKLQQALDERAMFANECQELRGMLSPQMTIQTWEDEDRRPSQVSAEDGFLVDFEIDPTTMEVRVEVVSGKEANAVPLVDVTVAGDA